MKDIPILFSGPMVQAILEGRKTQTRRIINPQPVDGGPYCGMLYGCRDYSCPYGAPGDRLWVRESWVTDEKYDDLKPSLIPESAPIEYKATDLPFHIGKSRPSIFMCRWMSRITLEIKDIRVERLKDLSEEDAQAEGCVNDVVLVDGGSDYKGLYARERFMDLWNSINGKRFPWDSNPWVWAVEFKVD